MPRIPRSYLPQYGTYHATILGVASTAIVRNDDERRFLLGLLAREVLERGWRVLAWCLMDNHVHLILVPPSEDSLRATLAEAHRRYSRMVNMREDWRGYLFQGRFASYPMDEAYLMAAVRYVERNPVEAKMVRHAGFEFALFKYSLKGP